MKTRTVEEIEQAFREMGLTEKTWGQLETTKVSTELDQMSAQQIFIRTSETTTPLQEDTNANLA